MKMHNFTIRGNCLEIVGRVVNNGSKNPVTVYDLEFPCGMGNLSLKELKDAIKRIEEDVDSLLYCGGGIRDETISGFEDAWSEDEEDDAHGA